MELLSSRMKEENGLMSFDTDVHEGPFIELRRIFSGKLLQMLNCA